jgi:hypothetical protein
MVPEQMSHVVVWRRLCQGLWVGCAAKHANKDELDLFELQ